LTVFSFVLNRFSTCIDSFSLVFNRFYYMYRPFFPSSLCV